MRVCLLFPFVSCNIESEEMKVVCGQVSWGIPKKMIEKEIEINDRTWSESALHLLYKWEERKRVFFRVKEKKEDLLSETSFSFSHRFISLSLYFYSICLGSLCVHFMKSFSLFESPSTSNGTDWLKKRLIEKEDDDDLCSVKTESKEIQEEEFFSLEFTTRFCILSGLPFDDAPLLLLGKEVDLFKLGERLCCSSPDFFSGLLLLWEWR